MPLRAMPKVSKVVATGRRMKMTEKFMLVLYRKFVGFSARFMREPEALFHPASQPVEGEVDNRSGEQCQHLAHKQTADHGDAERMAQFGADTGAQHQRQSAEQRRHGGHQDRRCSALDRKS